MSPFPAELLEAAAILLQSAREKGTKIVTAESCTGGLIAALLTEIPGSSDVVLGGHVTYANEAKMAWLGVSAATLANHGAVSEQTARAMAEGMVRSAQGLETKGIILAVAVTGIAGPGGGSAEKPVGTVHIATSHTSGITQHEKKLYQGSRDEIRLDTVRGALDMMTTALECVD